MIGNDIVDIAEAKVSSNWKRAGYLQKVFTEIEQEYIYNSQNPFLSVWRIWSMKEAAYKLYTQLHPSRFYNPKAFCCEINDLKGKVKYKSFECFVNSQITTTYILSEARLNNTKMTSICIEFNSVSPELQSQKTRKELLSAISQKYKISQTELGIEKSEYGVPSVYYNNQNLSIGITMSHHGAYSTYAIA